MSIDRDLLRRWALCYVAFAAACSAGCGPLEPDAQPAADLAESDTARVQKSVGQYMPPLPGLDLEIAAPRGWEWTRAGGEYVVGFVPKGSQLNNLPRILVSAEENPFLTLDSVSKDNVEQFAALVAQEKAGEELAEPVQSIILGNNALVHYATFAKSGNAIVRRQYLETVVGDRHYTIRMEVHEQKYDKYRDAAYAVAMSMKFGAAGDTPSAEAPAGEAP